MKGWLDKYGKEINANEGHSSASKEWIGEGYSNVGRNYSPAWGGQFKDGGKKGPGPKKPFFSVSNFAEPNYVAGQNPEGHYGYSDNTIWYDPNSEIENVNNPWWIGHEQYHHYQTLTGKNPRERRQQELDNEVNRIIQNNPGLQFIPKSKLITGSRPDEKGRKSFVGAEDRIYEDPSTLEGEARLYEQYIDNGGKSIFPKPNLNSTNNYPTESAPLRQGLEFAMGGSLPGSVGFTYARTGSIPSNGPYAKKTKASAQKGKEIPYHPITNPEGFRDKNLIEKINKLSNVEKGYEPTNAVKNLKSILSGASLAGSGNPLTQYLTQVAGGTGDLYTAGRYAADQNWNKAREDALQGVLGFIPYAKSIPGMKIGTDYFTKGARLFNRILKTGQNASDVKTLTESPKPSYPVQENGGMTYYQHGLDWKPKSISKNGSVIEDDRGQWAHRGKVTEIQGNSMATHGYGDLPLYVVPDVGEPIMVEANTGTHTFPGATKFTEYPINKKSKGWLDKYN